MSDSNTVDVTRFTGRIGQSNEKEIDSFIVDSIKAGKSIRKLAEELGVSHNTVRNRIKMHKLDVKVRTPVNNWKLIVQNINTIHNPFYQKMGMYPVELRQMYYRLIEVNELTKSRNNYMGLSRVTSEARRGCTSDFLRKSRYEKMPIDCFIDKSPPLLGQTDIDKKPEKPTPDKEPQDPLEYLQDVIDNVKTEVQYLKNNAIDDYDGECEPGDEGVNCGLWYMQSNYVEVWVESDNLQKTINSLIDKTKVHVVSFGGVGSTTRLYKNCMRIKQIKDSHKHVKKIVILYCGDLDSTGDWLDEYIVNAIRFYTGMEDKKDFELKRVAVLPEHIEKYDLVEDPEYNPEENGDPRFERFNAKYPELIEKYGEKFGIQVEAMLTTEDKIEEFKELLQNAIWNEWNEDIYNENCPPEEYDYEVNEEEPPNDIDIDHDYPDFPGEGEEGLTLRQVMERRRDQALQHLDET